MFCTKCGIDCKEQDRYCAQCGTPTGVRQAYAASQRLSRPVYDKKIAGVCAGFARHFGVDVTLVRVIWLLIIVWPLPLFGIISYLIAWIVMPRDPVMAPVPVQTVRTA